MKILKYCLATSIVFSCVSVTQAAPVDIFYKVPFSNVQIKPASKIYVDYKYDSQTQKLVCQSEQQNDAITSVEWMYKNTFRKLNLPVTLKDQANVEGFFSDPEGQLVIINEYGSNSNDGSIFVSCEYQKIR